MRPLEALKKHTELNPKSIVIGSIHEDGTTLLNVIGSNLADLIVLHHLLGIKVQELSTEYTKEATKS